MIKSLATFAFALALGASACATSPEEELRFDEDSEKADVVRPYGTFRRNLAEGEAGFTLLKLNEDRTYEASQELVTCEPNGCTDAFSGTYRFASSNGKKYIVLYNGGDWWYSFEYKLERDLLRLRDVGTDDWFAMPRATAGLALTESDNNGSFEVTEGHDVVVALPANPSTGYRWKVSSTDRTFGYPMESFAADSGATGSGGTATFTWKTSGPFSMVGSHQVTMEYRRSWETSSPATRTFRFTVDVKAAP